MRYLTAEELKEGHLDEVHEILEKCAGKSVRDLFAVRIFDYYISRFFKNRGQIKILDLGPASGIFLNQIKGIGYQNFYGVDLDDYRMPEHKPLFKEFRTADLSWNKLPWPDNSFQVATAWCVLPHLENPFQAIRETHRILDKDGVFIFTAPHLTSKPSMDYFQTHKDFGSYRGTNNHLVIFTKGITEKAVLKYFDLVAIEYNVRPKIFRDPKGKLYKLAYKLASLHPFAKKWLDNRWGLDTAYILKKK